MATIVSKIASGAIAKFRIVKAGSPTTKAVQADAGSQPTGVNFEGPVADTKTFDVLTAGVARVELGGTVAVGDYIKPDANGKGVLASVGDKYVGTAIEAGTSGQFAHINVAPGTSVPSQDLGTRSSVVVLPTADPSRAGALYSDGGVLKLSGTGATIVVLPDADPHIAGALWNNTGTVTISAG